MIFDIKIMEVTCSEEVSACPLVVVTAVVQQELHHGRVLVNDRHVQHVLTCREVSQNLRKLALKCAST